MSVLCVCVCIICVCTHARMRVHDIDGFVFNFSFSPGPLPLPDRHWCGSPEAAKKGQQHGSHVMRCLKIDSKLLVNESSIATQNHCVASSSLSQCVARVPVSLWGFGGLWVWESGGEAAFAGCCVCACNRLQPSATICDLQREGRKALPCAEAPGSVESASRWSSRWS